MAVLHCPGVWLFVLVVHLVNVFVEKGSVESSVCPIETGIFNHKEEREMNKRFMPVCVCVCVCVSLVTVIVHLHK